jgi:hypothetical protein
MTATEGLAKLQSVQLFWAALQNLKLDDTGVLTLPEGVSFMGDPTFGRRLFVRDCYPVYYDFLVNGITENMRGFVFTGTPGIGKSRFALYCLWRLATTPGAAKVVYYQTDPAVVTKFVIDGTAVVQRFEDTMLGSVALPTHFYFVDLAEKRPPANFNGITVVFASPQPARTHEFLKKAFSVSYCMPVCTLDEIQRMRAAVFPGVSVAQVEELVGIYGGIPRSVLQLAPQGRQSMDSALTKTCDYAKLMDLVAAAAGSQTETEAKIASTLVHLVPDPENPTRSTLHWASEYVVNEVLQRCQAAVMADLKRMVLYADSLHPAATLRGWLFEGYAHLQLARGAVEKLQALPLSSGFERVFPQFSSKEPVIVPSGTELHTLNPNVYYRPAKRNLESVDAFAKVGQELFLFQITVAARHPVKGQGLLDIITTFGRDCTVTHLVFVLPKPVRESAAFEVQRVITQGNADYARLPMDLSEQRLKQWVCYVPL